MTVVFGGDTEDYRRELTTEGRLNLACSETYSSTLNRCGEALTSALGKRDIKVEEIEPVNNDGFIIITEKGEEGLLWATVLPTISSYGPNNKCHRSTVFDYDGFYRYGLEYVGPKSRQLVEISSYASTVFFIKRGSDVDDFIEIPREIVANSKKLLTPFIPEFASRRVPERVPFPYTVEGKTYTARYIPLWAFLHGQRNADWTRPSHIRLATIDLINDLVLRKDFAINDLQEKALNRANRLRTILGKREIAFLTDEEEIEMAEAIVRLLS